MKSDGQADQLKRAVATIQARILALVCGLIGGAGFFLMTAWLLIRGGPDVGPHLQLLGQYFVGYSVTWPGSIVGLCYGMLAGGAVGWAVARIYNAIVGFRRR